jgi:hypothetical protein
MKQLFQLVDLKLQSIVLSTQSITRSTREPAARHFVARQFINVSGMAVSKSSEQSQTLVRFTV